jgi:beta-glucosidase
MNRIDKRLAAMAVEEKIGQLNMVAAGIAVTGPLLASGAAECIRARRIGNLLNLWGA